MKYLNSKEASDITYEDMPKEMSDWIDERINSGQNVEVVDQGEKGFAMKSRDCTVVFFPLWNCDQQFQSVANRNRAGVLKAPPRQSFY